jgi:hypothetical protein
MEALLPRRGSMVSTVAGAAITMVQGGGQP